MNRKDEIQSLVKQFGTLLDNITNKAQELGKIVIRLIELDPRNYAKTLQEAYPDSNLNGQLLARLYKIGRGDISPRLLFRDDYISSELEKLPTVIQEQIIDMGPVPVVTSSKSEPIQVRPINMTRDQFRTAIDTSRVTRATVRPVETQRSLARERSLKTHPPRPERYTLSPDGLGIHFNETNWTLRDLLGIVSIMVKKAGKTGDDLLADWARKALR